MTTFKLKETITLNLPPPGVHFASESQKQLVECVVIGPSDVGNGYSRTYTVQAPDGRQFEIALERLINE